MDDNPKLQGQSAEEIARLREQISQLQDSVNDLEQRNEQLKAQLAATGLQKKTIPSQPAPQSELALAEEYTLLRTLIDHIPELIYAKDTQSRFILNNAHSLKGLGASHQSEVIGKTDFDFFDPEYAQTFFDDEQAIMASGKALINKEELFLRPDGKLRWLLTSKVPVKDDQGRVVGLVGMSWDITRQKLVQDAVTVSRGILERLIQQLPIGVQIFDTSGVCISVNKAQMQIFGLDTPEQVVGHFNLFEDTLARETGIQAAAEKARQGLTTHLPEVDFDFSRANPNFGSAQGHRVLAVTFFPVRNSDGEIVQLVSLNEDITHRKQAEAELRLSDEILQQMPDAILVTDLNGRILRWLGMARQIFGYTADEAVNQPLDFMYPPNSQITLLSHIKQTIKRSGRYLGEMVCVKKDGTELPVEIMAKLIYHSDGSPAGYIVINRDISEKKQALQAIKQAETNYQTLVEQLPAITYIIEFAESGRRLTYISPQVESLLGFSQAEWLRNPNLWVEQIHPVDREEVLAEMDRSAASGEGLNIEYRVLARDGRILWFRNQTALLDNNGSPHFAHGVMFDITRQKILEEQLRQMQKMEAVGQMAGGVAHNFNNVLTALIGHAELALDGLSKDHPVRFDLEGIKRSAQRAASLTHQLLTFTRHQVTQPELLNLNDLVENMDDMIRQIISYDVELVTQSAEKIWNVKADPAQLEQVLVNLIVNARDAMPSGGTLTIETANVTLTQNDTDHQMEISPGDYVLLSVSDTGSGISPDVQSRIFEPFFTTKEVGQGTGLGLSTCFGIVKQNKGHIDFETAPGVGTSFKIYLPRAAKRTKSGTFLQIVQQRSNVEQQNEIILLVEDSAMIRSMAARVLKKQGYTVLEAADGEEALTLLDQQTGQPPHLVITDLSMPKMGGDILASQIQKTNPAIKILLISGHTNRSLSKQGMLDAGYDILLKPFTPDLLVAKVKDLLAAP